LIKSFNSIKISDKCSSTSGQPLIPWSSSEVFRRGQAFVHAMWFDIYDGEVYLFSRRRKTFVQINELSVPSLLAEMNQTEEELVVSAAV